MVTCSFESTFRSDLGGNGRLPLEDAVGFLENRFLATYPLFASLRIVRLPRNPRDVGQGRQRNLSRQELSSRAICAATWRIRGLRRGVRICSDRGRQEAFMSVGASALPLGKPSGSRESGVKRSATAAPGCTSQHESREEQGATHRQPLAVSVHACRTAAAAARGRPRREPARSGPARRARRCRAPIRRGPAMPETRAECR